LGTKITEITRPTIKNIRGFIEADTDLVASVLEAFGLKVEVGNASYSSSEVTFKVKLTVPGTENDERENDYRNYGPSSGLDPEWLGKSATDARGGREYTVLGYMPRRSKYPILCMTSDKGERLFTASGIKRIFEAQYGEYVPAWKRPSVPVPEDFTPLSEVIATD
tara:strand:+ start:313 stop:807 length:495 start_codon:yes stop_codon:yes gene_type:complete